MDNEKKKISITLKPDVATGKYANISIIGHSRHEFIIDFGTMLPGMPSADIHSRIIMAPEHSRHLLNLLAENIRKYEETFGPIAAGENEQPRTINLADLPSNGTKS